MVGVILKCRERYIYMRQTIIGSLAQVGRKATTLFGEGPWRWSSGSHSPSRVVSPPTPWLVLQRRGGRLGWSRQYLWSQPPKSQTMPASRQRLLRLIDSVTKNLFVEINVSGPSWILVRAPSVDKRDKVPCSFGIYIPWGETVNRQQCDKT